MALPQPFPSAPARAHDSSSGLRALRRERRRGGAGPAADELACPKSERDNVQTPPAIVSRESSPNKAWRGLDCGVENAAKRPKVGPAMPSMGAFDTVFSDVVLPPAASVGLPEAQQNEGAFAAAVAAADAIARSATAASGAGAASPDEAVQAIQAGGGASTAALSYKPLGGDHEYECALCAKR